MDFGDLRPRLVLRTPAGAVVLDPLGTGGGIGGGLAGTVNIGGVAVPYEWVFGEPDPVAVGPLLSENAWSAGALAVLGLAGFLLWRASR